MTKTVNNLNLLHLEQVSSDLAEYPYKLHLDQRPKFHESPKNYKKNH